MCKGSLFVPLLLLFLIASCGKNSETSSPEQLINSQIIVGETDWVEIGEFPLSSSVVRNGKAVAELDLPMLGSRCTGFMITKDVIMTNQHCIPSAMYASGVTAIFNKERGKSDSQYRTYKCDQFVGNNEELDFALLKCEDSPGEAEGTVSLSTQEASVPSSIYVIQQNCDYYTERDCLPTKKVSQGTLGEDQDEYSHDADTLGGSSGSPVFDNSSHVVVAIHHAGLGNNGMGRGLKNFAVPMWKISAHIAQNFPHVFRSPTTPEEGHFSYETALDVGPGYAGNHNLPQNKSFFFKFTRSAGSEFSAKVEFEHDNGDIDLKVYNSARELVAKSETVSDTESVDFSALSPGTYYLKVYGYRGASNSFSMKLEGTTEDYEPNNSFSKAAAVSLPFDLKEKIASSTDLDYFKFQIQESGTKSITLSFTHQNGDLDIFLYNSSGKYVAKSNGVSSQEVINKFLAKGDYVLKVRGYKGATGDYELKIH